MPVLICWIAFCFSYLVTRDGVPFYSGFAESLLVGGVGFFVYGFGWIYQKIWSDVQRKSFFLKVFNSFWWPISPLFFIFFDELEKISTIVIFGYIFFSIASSFFFNCFKFYESVIKVNADDLDRLKKIKHRSDMWWFDVAYWCGLAWQFVV